MLVLYYILYLSSLCTYKAHWYVTSYAHAECSVVKNLHKIQFADKLHYSESTKV